jgi:endoglucanase/cellulose 1,4-beta-cellobiosidase
MTRSRRTSPVGGPRLLSAVALTVALAAAGVIAAKDPAGATPGTGMVPGMATVNPSSWTGSGTPVPPVPASPSPNPLAPPTDFAVAGVTSTSVTLTWTTPAHGDVIGYTVSYRRRFNDVPEGVTVGAVTTTTITGLSPAWDYTFSLSARAAGGGTSGAANKITVVTPGTDTGPDTTPPSTPTGLTRTSIEATTVGLQWQPSTDDVGVTGYDVYYFNGSYGPQRLATVTGTSYRAPLIAGGYMAQYFVRARDAAGNVSIATDPIAGTGTYGPPPSSDQPPASTPPPPPGCRLTYRTTAEWQRGFAAQMTIINAGQATVDGWTLTFTFGGDQRIVSSWNSTFRQDGADVTMTNVRWNARLAPGDSTTVGMAGTHTARAAPAGYFRLNGQLCTLG